MAKGRVKRQLLFGLTAAVFALLIIAGIMPNPFPAIWQWLSEERPLAPGLAWQERLGSRPDSAAVAGDSIAVATNSTAQLYERDSGEIITVTEDGDWSTAWVVVAGSGPDAVVITSVEGGAGYQVRRPNGRISHEDEHAVAVWGYRDGWLDLRCDDGRVCQVRAYQPGRIEPVWRTDLPGERAGMLGADPDLAGPRRAEVTRIDAGVSGPARLPPLLGFTVTRRDADLVVVVDTATGRIVREWEQTDGERVIVVERRIIRSELARHNGVCVSTVTGYDPVTGDAAWGPRPYHLWGTGDVGCEQRVPPLAGGAALAAVTADGRPIVIDAHDGRVIWEGKITERIEGLSPDHAVIRAEDETTVYAVALGRDGTPVWDRRTDEDSTLIIAQCGVIVADRHPNRVYVWDPHTGEDTLSLSTSARVLACAPDGLLITEGRSVGFARFDGATEAPPPGRPPDDSEPPLEGK
jgi:hypothetical protein